jgi:hypothetical protein
MDCASGITSKSLEGDVIVHVLKQAFYLKKPSMTEQRAVLIK